MSRVQRGRERSTASRTRTIGTIAATAERHSLFSPHASLFTVAKSTHPHNSVMQAQVPRIERPRARAPCTQPPLAALAAPCSPYSAPRPSPTPRAFPAPAGCSWGPKRLPGPASGLPAGCLPLQRCVLLELCLPALSARGLLQRSYPCSNSVQSGSFRGCLGVLEVPRVGIGRVQKRVLWSF